MRFFLEFECENEAFEAERDDEIVNRHEVTRLIRGVADRVEKEAVGVRIPHGTIVDINGNSVGSWYLGE